MIFDGKWKKELNRQSQTIEFWRKRSISSNRAICHLNRAILYSAIVLRKAMEDEREADKISTSRTVSKPRLELINAELIVKQYPYTSDDNWFVRGKICAGDYGMVETVSLPASKVCNQLIHSYVWSLVGYKNKKGVSGFLVASDTQKEKCVYFVSFVEWKRLMKIATERRSF